MGGLCVFSQEGVGNIAWWHDERIQQLLFGRPESIEELYGALNTHTLGLSLPLCNAYVAMSRLSGAALVKWCRRAYTHSMYPSLHSWPNLALCRQRGKEGSNGGRSKKSER